MIIDVSNPNTPNLLSNFDLGAGAGTMYGFAQDTLDSNIIYITHQNFGLYALNITDKTSPVILGSFARRGLSSLSFKE